MTTTHQIVVNWKSPTQGIRVHVKADDTVEVTNDHGVKSFGIETIDDVLDATMTYGNERSVLLTSERAGWKTPVEQKIVSLLFQPSVQIYIVHGT